MRYSNLPAEELRPVLGPIPAGWMQPLPGLVWLTDADGQPIAHAVFADTDTGLAVIADHDAPPGRFPLRAENRKPPLRVVVQEPANG